jgi:hypothetical protein
MLIVDQEATAQLAATVKAAGCRYDQGILGADCITPRRMTARPFGRQLHAVGERHSKAAVPGWSPHIPGMPERHDSGSHL